MAIDNKYGRVTTEFGEFEEDEPVVIFRATDKLLPKVLMYYHLFCLKAGSPRHHLDLILDTLAVVRQWQDKHPVRTPNSDRYMERVGS